MRSIEKRIWVCVVLIMGMGLLSLYSATFNNLRVPRSIFWDQFICALLSLGLMSFLSRIDYRKYYDFAYVVYAGNILLLLIVDFAGRHALGARRWIEIGSLSFQPSELAKLSLILALGRYLSSRRPTFSFSLVSRWQMILRDLGWPLLIMGLSAILVFKQPDLGTSFLLFGIFIAMLFISGISLKLLGGFLAICIALMPFGWELMHQYQRNRLLVFLNPNIDPLGAGYTIIQSKIAIGSGQIFGKGWLSGTQNQLNFLPERHTDFIFSVVGEEWGLAGGLFLIVCYFILIQCGLFIAERINDRFGFLVTMGIVSILGLQVIINMGMVMGLFPIVGITLPFISYGRTSFLIFAIMMGFLLNLSYKGRGV